MSRDATKEKSCVSTKLLNFVSERQHGRENSLTTTPKTVVITGSWGLGIITKSCSLGNFNGVATNLLILGAIGTPEKLGYFNKILFFGIL